MPATPPAPTTGTTRLQRSSFPYCGRLTVLQNSITGVNDPFAGLASLVYLNFPSMPDVIDLSRTADYLVSQVITSPDGFHQYKATSPLSIPLSFKLHAMDKEFCPNGALSVLQAVALMQSFILPLSDASGRNSLNVSSGQANPGQAPGTDTNSLNSRADSSTTPTSISPETGSDFAPPVVLRLDLLFTDTNNPGIVCIGYVKDVRTRLLGPFMRGPKQSYNLPTAAEFEFTFVHAPGYGNSLNIAANPQQQSVTITQAFANDVKDKLFNTVDISRNSDTGFRGFNK